MKIKAQSTTYKEDIRDLRGRVNRALSDVQQAIQSVEQARVIAERAKGELIAILQEESHAIRVSLDKSTERHRNGQLGRRRPR